MGCCVADICVTGKSPTIASIYILVCDLTVLPFEDDI